MTPAEVLETLLNAYRRYYNIQTEDVEPPFAAEAAFHTHDEQYFLVKRARISEMDSHEYVFFALGETLSLSDVQRLDAAAWERGLSRVKPHANHRSTDVVLVMLAEHITPDAMDCVRKLKHRQSYRFLLQCCSDYRLVALDVSAGTLSCNRRGRDLQKLFRNIIPHKEAEEEKGEISTGYGTIS